MKSAMPLLGVLRICREIATDIKSEQGIGRRDIYKLKGP